MKTRLLFAAAAILCWQTITPFSAASPLSDILEKKGLSWMIGTWTGLDGAVTMTMEWRVEKNAIRTTLTTPEREVEGMTVLKPGSSEGHYVSVDSHGNVSKGQWSEFNGNPLLTVNVLSADSEEKKRAVEHIRVDNDTQKIKIYHIGDDGKPDESSAREIELKRKKDAK